MPVLSTRAANSAEGFGLGLSANSTVVPYAQYGWEVNTPVSNNAPFAVFVTADGTAAYSINVNFSGTTYTANAYTRNATTGFLTYVNSITAITTTANGGATLTVSPDGKYVFITYSNDRTSGTETQNYVLTYTINPTTKGFSPTSAAYNFSVGTGTGVFYSTVSPDGKFIYTGSALNNRIYISSINSSTGQLTAQTPTTTPASTFPRSVKISANGNFAYAVSYESTGTNGVLQFSVNTTTGALTALSPAGLNTLPLGQPAAISPNGRFLYVGTPTGLSIFVIDPFAGTLTLSLNQSGTSSTTVTFSSDSTTLLSASSSSSDVNPTASIYQGTIDPSTGVITTVTNPNLINVTNTVYTPYGLTASPNYDFYYFPLGYIYYGATPPYYPMSEIVVCKFINGYLTPINFPGNLLPYKIASSGATAFNATAAFPSYLPSRVAISPDGKFAYTNAVSTYFTTGAIFNRDTYTGQLTYSGTSALNGSTGNADLVISPDGNHAYSFFVDNSGSGGGSTNSKVYQYSRDTNTGALTALSPASVTLVNGYQYSLNNPTFSPDGTSLYVAASNYTGQSTTILAFSRNTTTGLLTYINNYAISIFTNTTSNQYFGVVVAPSGNYVYGLDTTNPGQIVTFSRNTSTGALTRITGTGGLGYKLYAFCLTPNGKNLYVLHSNSSGNLQIDTYSVNTSTGALTYVSVMTTSLATPTSYNPGMTLVCSPNGKALYFCVGGGAVYQVTRNVNTGTLSSTTNQVTLFQYSQQMSIKNAANGLRFSPDGKSLYVFTGPYIVQLVVSG